MESLKPLVHSRKKINPEGLLEDRHSSGVGVEATNVCLRAAAYYVLSFLAVISHAYIGRVGSERRYIDIMAVDLKPTLDHCTLTLLVWVH